MPYTAAKVGSERLAPAGRACPVVAVTPDEPMYTVAEPVFVISIPLREAFAAIINVAAEVTLTCPVLLMAAAGESVAKAPPVSCAALDGNGSATALIGCVATVDIGV